MARYYKGAGVGTYWHNHDARHGGFVAAAGGMPGGPGTIKSHIVNQTVDRSPYISITRSWEIAETFAKYGGRAPASATTPGYVYVIEISDSRTADLIDPLQELAGALGTPFASYQHDGGQDIILDS